MCLSGFALCAFLHPIPLQISAMEKEIEQKKKDSRKGRFYLVRSITIL